MARGKVMAQSLMSMRADSTQISARCGLGNFGMLGVRVFPGSMHAASSDLRLSLKRYRTIAC